MNLNHEDLIARADGRSRLGATLDATRGHPSPNMEDEAPVLLIVYTRPLSTYTSASLKHSEVLSQTTKNYMVSKHLLYTCSMNKSATSERLR